LHQERALVDAREDVARAVGRRRAATSECRQVLTRGNCPQIVRSSREQEAGRRPDRDLPAQAIRLTAQLVLAVVDAPDPGVLRAELAGEADAPLPPGRRRHLGAAARGGMVE